jgi:NAD-dependent deacetylase
MKIHLFDARIIAQLLSIRHEKLYFDSMLDLSWKKKIVVLTGAGMSAESGLRTFRDSNGLWEEYSIYDVATPEAFRNNPELVLRFYNERRKQLLECHPNDGHRALVKLEEQFDVHIITQNVDDLHERSGSKKVLHLHGELRKVRSSGDPNYVIEYDGDVHIGQKCPKGYQLRPHIVWFGEIVPAMELAEALVRQADILIVIGTSLQVYPAAGLVQFTDFTVPKYIIDPNSPAVQSGSFVEYLPLPASEGVPLLVKRLINEA